jgi:ATP-dependent phosphofructokinase / diphosphate-dependent phosphofructokinase|tara:strand:+ start:155 stop:1447 length:1293 start_codon:yes stop_codon:yes gene_type:complete
MDKRYSKTGSNLKMKKNIFYAQSGGVTPVINATAAGLIDALSKNKPFFGKLLVGKNGIAGALNEELIDISKESKNELRKLIHTPGGAFGSCRIKLKDPVKNKKEFQRILDVFKAHNIGYFFYNGGGDSQDTTLKISNYCKANNYDINCIGLPKTIDNDLPITDNCPGFGSVAKYIAVSTYEASLDVASMANSSTKVFILEVMGRHAGWLAASAGVIKDGANTPPHIILLPEVIFNQKKFLTKVKNTVENYGYCVIVASEGIKNNKNHFIAASDSKDSFGHAHLGGVAPKLADMITNKLKHKVHWAVSDYLQRAARHVASDIDVKQAYAIGYKALSFAKSQVNGVMLTINKKNTSTYQWNIGTTKLSDVANIEKILPKSFITKDGFGITSKCKKYIGNLIKGENYPPYKNGLPDYAKLKHPLVKKKLKKFS